MKSKDKLIVLAAAALLFVGCGKGSHPAAGAEPGSLPASQATCAHAACGDDYFVDAAPVGDCASGAACTVSLTLVALGSYHINDEYPYRFKADEQPGVDFLGTDAAGTSVFSKSALNWSKSDEKTGKMNVSFKPRESAAKTISGLLKLSVCSAQNCRLEHQQVKTVVAVR